MSASRCRLVHSDATVEALADVLRDNPRGVLMVTEEFASWIGGIDAYRDGAGSKAVASGCNCTTAASTR